jgi:uncharacterized protein (TIGR03067 family)
MSGAEALGPTLVLCFPNAKVFLATCSPMSQSGVLSRPKNEGCWRTSCGWFCLLLLCLSAGCKTLSTADSADDVKNLQGTWKLVSSTYDGEPQIADMEWIIEGDHYTIRLNQQSHEDPYIFKLDASRKRIDVTHHETPAGTSGGSLKGIYEIGNDSLTVCYDLTGQGYPEAFDAKRGSRQVLYQFRRE